jgi:hypothetical protein
VAARLGHCPTLAANVAHGLGHGLIGAAVGAWPAVALVGSYELLLVIIRSEQRPADTPQPGLTVQQTLWIDPSSYPPVREVYSFARRRAKSATLTASFEWLPRNKSSLAALRAAVQQSAIPTGFRSLPASDLPLPAVTPAG